jgi:hypothetical protein
MKITKRSWVGSPAQPAQNKGIEISPCMAYPGQSKFHPLVKLSKQLKLRLIPQLRLLLSYKSVVVTFLYDLNFPRDSNVTFKRGHLKGLKLRLCFDYDSKQGSLT